MFSPFLLSLCYYYLIKFIVDLLVFLLLFCYLFLLLLLLLLSFIIVIAFDEVERKPNFDLWLLGVGTPV